MSPFIIVIGVLLLTLAPACKKDNESMPSVGTTVSALKSSDALQTMMKDAREFQAAMDQQKYMNIQAEKARLDKNRQQEFGNQIEANRMAYENANAAAQRSLELERIKAEQQARKDEIAARSASEERAAAAQEKAEQVKADADKYRADKEAEMAKTQADAATDQAQIAAGQAPGWLGQLGGILGPLMGMFDKMGGKKDPAQMAMDARQQDRQDAREARAAAEQARKDAIAQQKDMSLNYLDCVLDQSVRDGKKFLEELGKATLGNIFTRDGLKAYVNVIREKVTAITGDKNSEIYNTTDPKALITKKEELKEPADLLKQLMAAFGSQIEKLNNQITEGANGNMSRPELQKMKAYRDAIAQLGQSILAPSYEKIGSDIQSATEEIDKRLGTIKQESSERNLLLAQVDNVWKLKLAICELKKKAKEDGANLNTLVSEFLKNNESYLADLKINFKNLPQSNETLNKGIIAGLSLETPLATENTSESDIATAATCDSEPTPASRPASADDIAAPSAEKSKKRLAPEVGELKNFLVAHYSQAGIAKFREQIEKLKAGLDRSQINGVLLNFDPDNKLPQSDDIKPLELNGDNQMTLGEFSAKRDQLLETRMKSLATQITKARRQQKVDLSDDSKKEIKFLSNELASVIEALKQEYEKATDSGSIKTAEAIQKLQKRYERFQSGFQLLVEGDTFKDSDGSKLTSEQRETAFSTLKSKLNINKDYRGKIESRIKEAFEDKMPEDGELGYDYRKRYSFEDRAAIYSNLTETENELKAMDKRIDGQIKKHSDAGDSEGALKLAREYKNLVVDLMDEIGTKKDLLLSTDLSNNEVARYNKEATEFGAKREAAQKQTVAEAAYKLPISMNDKVTTVREVVNQVISKQLDRSKLSDFVDALTQGRSRELLSSDEAAAVDILNNLANSDKKAVLTEKGDGPGKDPLQQLMMDALDALQKQKTAAASQPKP